MPDPSEPANPSARDRIVAAALALIADMELADLTRALTPERLATLGPWSASTVRYQFGAGRRGADGRRFAFERSDLALAVLDRALEQTVRASADAAATYARAADALEETGSLDAVLDALADNMRLFTPGAAEDAADDSAPRQRVYHLALAVCDADQAAARRLRAARAVQVQGYTASYDAFLRATGRRPRDGRTVEDLADATYALLEGHLARLRFDPAADTRWLGDAVIAIFTGFTQPEDDEQDDPAGERRPRPQG